MTRLYNNQSRADRNYIRHPSDIPIQVMDLKDHPSPGSLSFRLNNVSVGGLSFYTSTPLEKEKRVLVEIPCVKPQCSVTGIVQWCQKVEKIGYEVGVQFTSHEDAFLVRMVEQVCHIEHYRKQIARTEGRELTGEEAAIEWIRFYAHEFPNPDSV